jgi:hypothetical protein
MKILISIYGEMCDIPMDSLKKWKITENKKIGETYFMRESGGAHFSMSEHYYNLYKIYLRDAKIDSILSYEKN